MKYAPNATQVMENGNPLYTDFYKLSTYSVNTTITGSWIAFRILSNGDNSDIDGVVLSNIEKLKAFDSNGNAVVATETIETFDINTLEGYDNGDFHFMYFNQIDITAADASDTIMLECVRSNTN